MNKTLQLHLANLPNAKIQRKDSRPRAFEICASNQHFKLELLKFDFDTHPIMNRFQLGEDFVIPETRNLFAASNMVQQIRIKGTGAGGIKKEFYNSKGECHQCGALVSKKFKNHTLAHFSEDTSIQDIDSTAQIKKFLDIKRSKRNLYQQLVNKAQNSNLVKRTFEELSNIDVDEIDKRYKAELAI